MRIKLSCGAVSLALAAAGVVTAGEQVAEGALLLAVDTNDRTAADGSTTHSGTHPSFSSFLLEGATGATTALTSSTTGWSQAVGSGYTMNVATALVYPNGGGTGSIQDADRNFAAPAAMTYGEMYDDVIYNASNTGGIRLGISGGELQPNTQYAVSIYTYDHGSATVQRTADWVDMNNADAHVLSTSFIGGGASTSPTVPQTNDSHKFTGFAMTDGTGMLSLKGINTSAITPSTGLPSQFGLFISGVEVNSVPEPTAAVGLISLAGLMMARRRGQ